MLKRATIKLITPLIYWAIAHQSFKNVCEEYGVKEYDTPLDWFVLNPLASMIIKAVELKR